MSIGRGFPNTREASPDVLPERARDYTRLLEVFIRGHQSRYNDHVYNSRLHLTDSESIPG